MHQASAGVETTAIKTKAEDSATQFKAGQYLRAYTQGLLDTFQAVRNELAHFTRWDGESRAKPLDLLFEKLSPTNIFFGDTWNNLEVNNLILKIVGCCEQSQIGRNEKLAEAVGLYRTFAQLPTDPAVIRLRQEAAQELEAQKPGAIALSKFFRHFPPKSLESLFEDAPLGDGYEWYHKNASTIKAMVQDVRNLPEPESALLREVWAELKKLADTEVGRQYCHGSAFTSEGIKPANEVGFLSRAFRFWPYSLDPMSMTCAAIPAGAGLSSLAALASGAPGVAGTWGLVALGGTILAVFVYFGKQVADARMVIKPLVSKAHRQLQPLFAGSVLVRELDLLNSFTANTSQPTSFLSVLDERHGKIEMERMGSPLHAHLAPIADDDLSVETLDKLRKREAIRLNDINQPDDAIQPDVGPNSGGKSFRRKAQFLNTLLFQAGAKSFCQQGRCSPFTKFFFTIPKNSESGSSEGSLGAELQPIGEFLNRTKVDSKSLVFCDELGRGTSEAAIAPRAKDILHTLQIAGARTSVASHNQALITALQDGDLRLSPLIGKSIAFL